MRYAEARRILQDAESVWKPGDPLSYFRAVIHARLRERDAAIEWLGRAFQAHESFLPNLKIDSRFDGLRGGPRFDELVKRIRITD